MPGGDRNRWARRSVRLRARSYLPAVALAAVLSGCAVGPDYVREPAPVPVKYKELKGWKIATPSDQLPRGDWWAFYRDRYLDSLISQVEFSNQNVAAQAAAFLQARAMIREAQSALFPNLSSSYTVTRTYTGRAVTNTGSTPSTGTPLATMSTTYVPSFTGSWDLDLWGRVRRQIESNASVAQMSAADLANVTLAAQAQLATAYFNVRGADALEDVLLRTVEQYKKTLQIVENQFQAGFSVTEADVSTAKAQVFNAQSLAINVGVQRAQNEHAIAMLIGRPPAELRIGKRPLSGTIPKIPVSVPSSLLERRPDIAAAERAMQAQNALIGVATAAYFPDISLSGMLEWIGHRWPFVIDAAHEMWSLGAAGKEILFEGGLRGAQLDAARAGYWQSVATYRQTVLTAFQGVEDQLAAIRLLTQQLAVERQAVDAQRRAVEVFINQFQVGTVPFTTVVTAEIQLLTYEVSEVNIRQNLFLASVALIQDLGGGWESNLLPTAKEMENDLTMLPQYPAGPSAVLVEATGPDP